MNTIYNRIIPTLLVFISINVNLVKAQEDNPLLRFKDKISNEKLNKITFSGSFDSDTVVSLFQGIDSICYLSISGNLKLQNKKGYIRIVLADENGFEYQILEANYLNASDLKMKFHEEFDETGILDKIAPNLLIISSIHAILHISSMEYLTDFTVDKKSIARLKPELLDFKEKQKIDIINKRIQECNMKWLAGQTSISRLNYEEKKAKFGGKVPNMFGFEYYTGGLFEIPNDNESAPMLKSTQSSPYAAYFDWRDRNGTNWNTSVKNQWLFTCWAYAAVAAVESQVNLYFNQKIDLDLSEGEVVNLTGGYNNAMDGGQSKDALTYISNNGIVDEECYPAIVGGDQSDKCSNPSEQIFINGRSVFWYSDLIDDEKLKHAIINNGVLAGVFNPWDHAMALTGYGTIGYGSGLIINDEGDMIDVDYGDPRNGKTYWIFKNSWGSDWGDDGYAYLYVSDLQDLKRTCFIDPIGVTSINLDDSDIVCEDNDMDGYCNYLIGDKPATCPSSRYDEKDGDDNDPCIGAIDEYGNIDDINGQVTTIATNQTWDDTFAICGDLVIQSNAIFTIKGLLVMQSNAHIILQTGGKLVVDGGQIENADIIVHDGCDLKIINNGVIEKSSNGEILVESGATSDFSYGEIK